MKILMVLMGLEIGGAETHVVELSKELVRRGHTITIASNGGVFVAELEKNNIRHISLPLHSRKPKNMLASYLGLKKLLKSEKFDVVHAHARIPAFLCGLVKRSVDFNFVTTTHWVFKTGLLLNMMTDWGERTIAVSNDIKDYLLKNYKLDEKNITVTINGIDTKSFSPDTSFENVKKEFGISDDAKKIVYVSRMDTDRSAVAFNLVSLMQKFDEKYKGIELIAVGGGNDFERLREETKKCNEKLGRNAVILTGARTDICNFVAGADLFVGVSRAALEAMSAAKPVIIAGNEGYIGVFAEDKKEISQKTNFCCRGCEMTDEDTLFSDIVSVLDKTDEERKKMGIYNREFILENYSEKRMADDCEKVYVDITHTDKKRSKDILISGYYGYKNMGDDSLLLAIVNNLRELKPDIDITVLSANPTETKQRYNVDSINRFDIFKIIGRMKKTKLFISGGGSLIQDVTSTKSLVYYTHIIKLAKKYGMKVMVYASGIGPVNAPKNRKLAGNVLNMADFITLRENASLKELETLGVTKPEKRVTTDPAFSLCEKTVSLSEEGIEEGQKFYVVSLRPWKKKADNFDEVMAELCDRIYEKYSYVPLFVDMQYGVDSTANKRVYEKMKTPYISSDTRYQADELMGIIKRAEFVVGMRLHILIYSATMAVPVVGLSYDPKVDSMLEYLEQKHNEPVEKIEIESIFDKVSEVIEKRQELSKNLMEKAKQMREKTVEDAKIAISYVWGDK